MKRTFFLTAMILLLAIGPSFGRVFGHSPTPSRVRPDGIAGIYVNKELGAVLTVKAMSKNKYTMILESGSKECGFDTRAELKNMEGIGFNLALADANYQASVKSDKIIHIEVRLGKNQCKEYVEGDYEKR